MRDTAKTRVTKGYPEEGREDPHKAGSANRPKTAKDSTTNTPRAQGRTPRTFATKAEMFSLIFSSAGPFVEDASPEYSQERIVKSIQECITLASVAQEELNSDAVVSSELSWVPLMPTMRAFSRLEGPFARGLIASIVDAVRESGGDNDTWYDGAILRGDLVADVRCRLLDVGVKAHEYLSTVPLINDSDRQTWGDIVFNITIDMCKDLAFNWDSEAIYRDRETLFVSNIQPIGAIVVSELRKLLDGFGDNVESNSTACMSPLKSAIEACDVGYNSHPTKDINFVLRETKKRLEQASDIVSAKNPSIRESVKSAYLAAIARNGERIWSDCADEFMSGILSKLNEMNEKEQEQWMSDQGSEPMDLGSFLDRIERCGKEEIRTILNEVDERDLARNSKKVLAKTWGLSDAICKLTDSEQKNA